MVVEAPVVCAFLMSGRKVVLLFQQTAATFSKAFGGITGDAGAYTCEISDSASPVNKVTSTSCTVTVS